MNSSPVTVDVLCVGFACYDLTFSVDHHPEPDDKVFAQSLVQCGGGPAANAAVAAARLGRSVAFAGYLGNDVYGDLHVEEFRRDGIITEFIARGDTPTPLSVILVKPDGSRTVVNYKGTADYPPEADVDFSRLRPKAILFDGRQPNVSLALAQGARERSIPTVLDGGSVHQGTRDLFPLVTHVVASAKFARQFSGLDDPERGLDVLAASHPSVVVTLGDKGLVWKTGNESGHLDALKVDVVDTTGAGDAFHGAFAAGLASGMEWRELLDYARRYAARCCTKMGARTGMAYAAEL